MTIGSRQNCVHDTTAQLQNFVAIVFPKEGMTATGNIYRICNKIWKKNIMHKPGQCNGRRYHHFKRDVSTVYDIIITVTSGQGDPNHWKLDFFLVSLFKPTTTHDDVIKWKHFPCDWAFVRGILRSAVNSPHKGQRRGALMDSLICAWINGWVNNGKAGDLRRHRAHYDRLMMHISVCL